MLNKQIPINNYQIDLGFNKGKFNVDLLTTIYSGNDTNYFTNNRFVISDLSMNYKLNKKANLYLVANNLWNTAWENRYMYHMGIGSFPQPGRRILVGMQYKF